MLSFNLDAMRAEILNHQSEVRPLPEELEVVKAELQVYQDMQANLNTNLSMYPDFLDAIEDLQCSVYPEDEMPSPYQAATDAYNIYFYELKAEVKRLHGELDDQERQIGIYDVTLRTCLDNEIRLESLLQLYRDRLAMVSRDYSENADMWRKAYEDLEQYKEPSC